MNEGLASAPSKRGGAASYALAAAVICVSSSAILTRFTDASPISVAGWRLGIAAALLALWPSAWVGLRTVSLPDLSRSAVASVFLAAHFGAWIASLRMLPVSVSLLVVSTHPIFVMAFRIAAGDWPSLAEAVGALAAFAGVSVMYASSHAQTGSTFVGRPETGFALALAGAIALAGYLLIGANVRRRLRTSSYILLVYSLSALALFGFLQGAGGHISAPVPHDLRVYLALALIPTLGGHGLFAFAVGRLRTIAVSTAFLMEPVVATLIAIPVLHEIPSRNALLGGALVLVGLVMVVLGPERVSCEESVGTRNNP
ncbi:MAG TPA: DMT family transporter [Armatimonadota bacterium]